MPAWQHSRLNKWSDFYDAGYRSYVMLRALFLRGRTEDCADLSMSLLIEYAAVNGLALTFEDNAGTRYISKAEGPILTFAGQPILNDDLSWSTPERFTEVVQAKIGVKALWNRNTEVNPQGPMPGDLMIIFGAQAMTPFDVRHHTAIVFRVYNIGELHPRWDDKSVPDFPGPDKAKTDGTGTEYFKGTVGDSGATAFRFVDGDTHFDYLNHRGSAKPNAELIYYASKRQALAEGFQFRVYSPQVLDNWSDWDGKGVPPR